MFFKLSIPQCLCILILKELFPLMKILLQFNRTTFEGVLLPNTRLNSKVRVCSVSELCVLCTWTH